MATLFGEQLFLFDPGPPVSPYRRKRWRAPKVFNVIRRYKPIENPLWALTGDELTEEEEDQLEADLERRREEVRRTWTEQERDRRNQYPTPHASVPVVESPLLTGGRDEWN